VWQRAVPQAGTRPPSHRPQRHRRRRLVIGTSALAVVLVAAAVLAYTFVNRGSSGTLPAVALPDGSAVTGGVTSVAFDPSQHSEILAAGDVDGDVYLWNFDTAQREFTLPAPPGTSGLSTGSISSVAFSPDGSTLAVGYNNGDVVLWDAKTAAQITLLKCPLSLTGGVSSVAFNQNSTLLAAGDGNGSVYIFNIANLAKISPNAEHILTSQTSELVSSVAFSRTGLLAVGDNNGNTYLWNPNQPAKPINTFPGSQTSAAGVSAVAFSPDGGTLAAANRGGSIALFNVGLQRQIATLNVPGGKLVNSVAFSPNGDTLASGDSNGRTYIWDVNTATQQNDLKDPGVSIGGVASVAFSPNGTMLAAGDGDDSTYMWNM
jgi:WD40 repeat protein